MAGHSKWANIKHRKGAQDKKRGKIFTRIIKDLTISSRDGGPDPDTNPSLRLAIQNAKGANMPKDTMERSIKKGSGEDSANLQEYTYEGYGPGGIAIFVEATSDNLNRTVASVRSIFSKNGGSLGTNGSLSFVFDRKGVFTFQNSTLEDIEADELELELIDGGAEEVENHEEVTIVTTPFEDFGTMQKKLEEIKLEPQSSELQRIPNNTIEVSLEEALKVMKLLDKFDDDDDISTVYHNMELTEELQKELSE
jgi:YebC/PmpR family DNA-binding regulatory protein